MANVTRYLSREDWIAAARKVLMTVGVDEVKVDRLSRTLKVTRGSFYWHFTSRKELLDALLRDWEVRNLSQIDFLREKWTEDPDLAYINLVYLGGDRSFPAFDMSVRIWARKAQAVAAAVARIDDAWIGILKELFLAQGLEETEAFVRARVNYFHQIGYYALALNEDVEERIRLIPYYYRILAAREPSPKLGEILEEVLEKQRRRRSSRTGNARRKRS